MPAQRSVDLSSTRLQIQQRKGTKMLRRISPAPSWTLSSALGFHRVSEERCKEQQILAERLHHPRKPNSRSLNYKGLIRYQAPNLLANATRACTLKSTKRRRSSCSSVSGLCSSLGFFWIWGLSCSRLWVYHLEVSDWDLKPLNPKPLNPKTLSPRP